MKSFLPLVLLTAVAFSPAATNGQLTYPAVVTPSGPGGSCPAPVDQIETISNITDDIRELLSGLTPGGDGMCGGTSGWRRLIYLDMSDTTQQCPITWSEITTTNGDRACGGITIGDQICDSTIFPNTDGAAYSQVCGRMVGYQLSAPDAFRPYHQGQVTTIEGPYLDGVSLTHGPSGSRQHIWSFAVGASETSTSDDGCPCNSAVTTVPPFVGENYFCESGVDTTDCSSIYFGDDPLWEGMNCDADPGDNCCLFNNPPYFTTMLPSSTADNLEVRLCSYDLGCTSDIAVSFMDIYVK